jgi:basic amino acid/polyamine antiporter, APA family
MRQVRYNPPEPQRDCPSRAYSDRETAMGTKSGLRRQLGLTSATALIVGEVIGLGIFLTPSEMALALRSPFWLLVVWLVMGAMTLSGALCYGELAARFPEAGGGYVYLREAFGRPMAFLFGWVSMVVIDPGITATLAIGLASTAAPLFALSPGGQVIVAVGTIVVLAAVNCLGVQLGAGVLRALTLTKLGLLALIVAVGFGHGLGNWNNFLPFVEQRPGYATLLTALAGGMVSAFFSFGGWWDVSKVAGEVRDPERTMPRALVLGVALVTVVFILITTVFVYLVPLESVTTKVAFAAQAGKALFGPDGAKVFAGIVILVVLGSLCSILMSQPRVYFAMARDGLILPALASIHPRLGTPVRAIALEAVLASTFVAWGGDFNRILGLFLFTAVLLVALSVASMFVLRRKPAPAGRLPWSGYPYTPVFYLVVSAVLLGLLGLGNPIGAGVGVVAVGVGLLAYRFLPKSAGTAR